jgi:heme-degrading monooxygenase HmoA
VIAVIFEVQPGPDLTDAYLTLAAALRPELEQVDGFLSVERFRSLTEPDKLLSLSFFRDEAAVLAWRRLSSHRTAQKAGRQGIFDDYRLRIAHVVRDYGMMARDEAPEDSRQLHG